MAEIIIESSRPTFGELALGAYFACDGVVYYKTTRYYGVCIAKVSDTIATEVGGTYSFTDDMTVKVIKHIHFR